MQVIKRITFSLWHKLRLWSFSAAVIPHTPLTSLEIIKDVIKHHQSRNPQLWNTHEHTNHLWHLKSKKKKKKSGRLWVIFTNTQGHWLPVSSCQVKGHTNTVTVGMPLRCSSGLRDTLKQDAADWKSGTMNRIRGGTHALPAQRLYGMGVFMTQLWHTSHSLWPINAD